MAFLEKWNAQQGNKNDNRSPTLKKLSQIMQNCSRERRQFREDFKVISLQFPILLSGDKKET